jgi:hypothetical protein
MLEAKKCKPGREQYEHFTVKDTDLVQYDFRALSGELFSTIALTLAEAQARRDKWLAESKFAKEMAALP